MKLRVLLTLVCLLAVTPALAAKVFIDYDPDYRLSADWTFAWKETAETSLADSQPWLHQRIVNDIESYLITSGASENRNAPNVYVTYHTSTKTELSLDTDHFGYGYPGGWSRWGYYGGYGAYGGTSTTTVRTYEKGSLVVDVWDAKSNKLVWRGMATEIYLDDNPDKLKKRIDKALKKMVKEWTKIRKKGAK